MPGPRSPRRGVSSPPRRTIGSPNAILGSKGQPKSVRRSVENISTVRHGGRGKPEILTVEGTPTISHPTRRGKAEREAVKVRKALERARKAFRSGGVEGPGIDRGESEFYRELAKRTGLSPRVLAAQGTQEGGADPDYNILNIGHTDSGSLGLTKSADFATPKGGAKATAQFLKGKRWGASRGIRDILKSAGASEAEQVAAIARSGWATDPNYHQGISSILPSIRAKSGKPKKKDTRTLRRAGIDPKRVRAETKEPPVKRKPGPWAGSQKAVLAKVPAWARPEGRGDKRTPAENSAVGGATNSDHLTTNLKSYAADLPADDSIARHIAKKLGLSSHTGTNQVVKDGYEYTLIWQDEGHYDHVHFGAEWVGPGIPDGTRLGGPSGGGTAGTGVSSGGSSSAGAAPGRRGGKSVKRAERKKRLRRVQAAYSPSSSSSTPTVDLSELERRYGSPAV